MALLNTNVVSKYNSNIAEMITVGQNQAKLRYRSKHNLSATSATSATCSCLYSRKYFNCKHMQIARFNAIDMIGNSMNLLERQTINLLIWNAIPKGQINADDDGILVCIKEFKRKAISSLGHPDEDPRSQILTHWLRRHVLVARPRCRYSPGHVDGTDQSGCSSEPSSNQEDQSIGTRPNRGFCLERTR